MRPNWPALLTDLVKDAEGAEKRARLRNLRDLDAAILLRDMAELVVTDDALPLDQWRDALFERLPRADLVAAMAEVDAIARPHDARPYAELPTRWCRARRLLFNIATRLQMDAGPAGKAVQEAMGYLAGVIEIAGLAKLLDGGHRALAERGTSNPDLRFETVQGRTRLVVHRSTGWRTPKACAPCARPSRAACRRPPCPISSWRSCSAPASPGPSRT